ncbi:BET1 homolog [Coccinella septempunctata]|uniref:BET1 homolog n=1 Tax=Coccinella septempunctata TaxID=41139 RepID=UPI001D063B46|nr:BET1 homolog [Coccinella septempunctata]
MRRNHAGYSYEPLPQRSNEIEDENDKLTEELRDKVNVLKSLSIDIGNEVRYQDRLMNDIDDDLERTGGFLGKTMNNVLKLSRNSHNCSILHIVLFSVTLFFILYIVLKFR